MQTEVISDRRHHVDNRLQTIEFENVIEQLREIRRCEAQLCLKAVLDVVLLHQDVPVRSGQFDELIDLERKKRR